MKIAFNPSNSSKNILDLIKNNKDIIFDLKGHSIYARGVEFKGTDTNTWRPVVDNLTSNSATSSLSANQGRVLAGLINGKSDSDHNHDGRYLKLTGGTLTGNLVGTSAMFSGRFYGNGDDEGIIIKPSSNGYAGLILGTHDGERSIFYFVKNKPFWRYSHGSDNLDIIHPKKSGTIALTSDIPSSVKNPYSLTTFGVVYDGSAEKVVSPSNFISQLGEGTSVVTDGTMFVTSYASDKGFADTNAVNIPYKRKAVHLWEYIKAKTDSLYATKNHNHDGRYVRTFGTSNDNIDSDWGESFKTFDPIPSGTPPEQSANISLLSIGNNFNRRKQLAFIYNNDNIYYRRRVDNGFSNWRRLAFANEIPTSLKNPHALTISLNGTSQGPYDGSAAKNINITPGSIGAATSDHNHDGRYVRKWTGVYGSANKFLKLVISQEKGWIRLEVSDSNNALSGGYGIYIIGWGWHGNNGTDTLTVRCLYANDSRYTTALKVVRTSRDNYDFYFQFASNSSYPSYTINYSSSISSIDCTVTKIATIPTATWTSSLSALQLNASQVDWSGITNKPSTFNPAAHTHTVFRNNLMIKGTNGVSDSSLIHLGIGDSDTGFKWISDGVCQMYANNVAVGQWTSGGMNWFKNPTVNGNKVWNAGNDGSGSGLDADTVDGEHASNFSYTHQSSFNFNTIKNGRIVTFDQSNTDYGWINGFASTHNNYLTSVIFNSHRTSYWYVGYMEGNYSTGKTNGLQEVHRLAFVDQIPTKLSQLTNDSGFITSSASISGNAGSATKLQTARRIWGQSFNGTADVNGTIYINNGDSENGAIILNNNVNTHARISAIGDQVVFNTGSALRFGGTEWEYSDWAGLKYDTAANTVYLGIADGTVFNYYSSKRSNGTLKLPGIKTITPDSGARIGGSGGDLYLGNANNNGWVKVQDICSHNGSDYWYIYQSGNAVFNYIKSKTNAYIVGNLEAGQIIRGGSSQMWVNGRNGALLRETSVAGYHTLWSLKTTDGSWDFGEYNAGSDWNNIPVLSYITDSNYNSGNNAPTYQIKFPLASGTVALTSNILNPTNYYWANVKISTSSSTTTSPTVHTLTATRICAGHDPGIDNSISCSNWFRSSGNTGWYNTTYKGGWYMSDTSWIRTHNSVGIYTSKIYADSSIRMSSIRLEKTNEINSSDNLLINYGSSTNVSLCNGGGNVGIGTMSPTQRLDVNGNIITKGFGIQPCYLSELNLLPTISPGDGYKYKCLEIGRTTEISCIIADKAGLMDERGILIKFNKGYDGQIILLKDLQNYGSGNGYFWVMPSGCNIIKADSSSILVGQNQISNTYDDGHSRFLVYSSLHNVWIEFLCANIN